MKKFLIHILLMVTCLILYLVQTIFFTNFTIAGVMPNLFVIFMLFIGLYMGRSMGIIYGIMYGIFIDLWMGKTIGIVSICLAIIGLLGGVFDKNFSKDSRITIILMGIIATILYEVMYGIIQYVILETNIDIFEFSKILAIEVVYNILLIIIIYPVMKLTGYEIENEIKGDKILTRYF